MRDQKIKPKKQYSEPLNLVQSDCDMVWLNLRKMYDINFFRDIFNLVCFLITNPGEKLWWPCKCLGIKGSSTNFQIHLSADWDPSRLPSNIRNWLQRVSKNQLCSSLSKRFHGIVTHLPHSNCLVVAGARQQRPAQGDPHHSHPFPARK